MRKTLVLITLLAMVCTLAFSVSAATAAKSVSSYATVSSDGSCQITLTANIHLDQPVENLRFPLPKKAGNITVNGSRAHGRVENGLRQVNLSGIIGKTAGDFTLTFHYSLPNLVVTNEAGLLELQLPLLAGFAYPVQALEFSVTLPGTVTAKPAFSSGYHQANIEKDIHCTTNGATVTGIAQVELKDHETLSMHLLVSEEMFPQPRLIAPDFQTVHVLITVFSLLALAYWVIFLRNLPSWPAVRTTPPEGYSAGEMGSVLHLQGGDLNMMVFSWAQLGYLLIRLEHSGRVILRRQMDMGNERTAFERHCFKQLFGRNNTVDTGSLRYGEICRNVQKMRPNLTALVHRKSGNIQVFRGLAATVGMFGGISVGISLSTGAALQWFLVFVLGAAALGSSWCIQNWAASLFAPGRQRLWLALGLCAAWLLISSLAGQFSTGLGLALGQLCFGLLAAFGGRRTPAGRQTMGETLGLRRYLKTVSKEQLAQICQNDPEYFHKMAPFAMALGVDGRFAKQFGKLPIGPCPYISIGTESTLRAGQWQDLMRRVYTAMTARQRRLWLEKLAALLQYFTR